MSSFEVDAAMPSPTEITVQQLARLVGVPGAPAIVGTRSFRPIHGSFPPPSATHPLVRSSGAGDMAANPLSWCVRPVGRAARPPTHSFATRASTLKPLKVATKPGARLASLSYVRRGYHRLTRRDAQYG